MDTKLNAICESYAYVSDVRQPYNQLNTYLQKNDMGRKRVVAFCLFEFPSTQQSYVI
jgi:hypothetical protein